MKKATKRQALSRIRTRLAEIAEIKNGGRRSPLFEKWCRDTEVAISNTFVGKDEYVESFRNINYSLLAFSSGTPESAFDSAFLRGLVSAENMLASMVTEIEEYWDDDEDGEDAPSPKKASVNPSRVFVAHGHSAMKTEVARLIERLGLNPIVLQEQPSKGRTIIEKFEEHSHVGFAVAVLTPDDEGRAKNTADLRPRARQNVIFELGFFVGKLGRKRVCALVDKTVERPSDYDGVVFISLDEDGAWKLKLAKELRQSGLNVDLNRLV